jgi:hypothetical protein
MSLAALCNGANGSIDLRMSCCGSAFLVGVLKRLGIAIGALEIGGHSGCDTVNYT